MPRYNTSQGQRAQSVIHKLLNDRPTIRVLDAGCGDFSELRLPERAYIVGIDLSQKQLERQTHLNEKVCGDIQTYRFTSSQFDLIICWWVLEHLPHPEQALNNFLTWLNDDGILVLALPNILSIKGLVTRLTPHRFHVWFYKATGTNVIEEEDLGPFRTYMKFAMSPFAVRRFAVKNNMSIVDFNLYESTAYRTVRSRYKALDAAARLVKWLINAASFGHIDTDLSECVVILQKRPGRCPQSGQGAH